MKMDVLRAQESDEAKEEGEYCERDWKTEYMSNSRQ
jgi:hypothetical protein